MFFLNLFFAIACTILCIANILVVAFTARKFPMMIVINGPAAILTGVAACFNVMMLLK